MISRKSVIIIIVIVIIVIIIASSKHPSSELKTPEVSSADTITYANCEGWHLAAFRHNSGNACADK